MVNALTVDVEEHFQVEAFADWITPAAWGQHPSRVVENTQRVLDLFSEFKVHATFFMVGWVAERHPELVRRIAEQGHELGCHSHLHRHITRLMPEEFRSDAQRARATIEDAGGVRVRGYRAPTFSIVPATLWALDILAEIGFEYDSSVFPVRHDLYGMSRAPRVPFRWLLPGDSHLYEFPASTVRMLGRNLPTGGGGYLRILPMPYIRWSLNRIAAERQPAMVYLHPWEVDPEQPRLPGRWKSRLRHYVNLTKMQSRLRALLARAEFTTMWQVLEARIAAGEVRDFAVSELGAVAQPTRA